MKNKYLFLLLCCCCFLFMGCPYNSEVSIDGQPAVKIEQKLLGKWQLRSSDNSTYVVEKKDDYTYTITEKHKPSGQDSGSVEQDKVYNAFLSDVDGTKFLNLFEPGSDNKVFYFYKVVISDEVEAFTLYPVTEYITEKFTSSADLKKFFQSYKDLSFFYGTKDEYIKVGK